MHVDPLFIPVLALGLVAFIAGAWAAERLTAPGWRALGFLAALALAVPGALFSLYYLHWFDHAQWFYELRTLPYSEFTASASGFFAGMLPVLVRRQRYYYIIAQTVALALLLCWLTVPYLKMLLGPLETQHFEERAIKGVCMQSTASTCGPASATTLAWKAGFYVTEQELARESFTTQSGTECWYLARALRSRGFSVRYIFLPNPPPQLIFHSMAGVRMGGPNGPGHFVAVLGETRDAYLIGDPAAGVGLARVKKSRLNRGDYYFTGFFMQVTHE